GFLHARPERQPLLKPLVVSWGWQPRQPGPSPFLDLFDWIGTDDPASFLSVPAAIAFQREHDWPAARARCHAVARDARERIGALTGLTPISPDGSEWWGQMFAAPLPADMRLSAGDLKTRLYDEFQVEVPIVEWQGQRFVRVSIQAYNSDADVERLLDGLRHLL
ncbi:MAG: aminotransferase class V-fold PLP-dependent enzyme, partial [Ktedonobacterales bacterium]